VEVATKKALDFVVIGAQKSGTSSLFQYLRHHPQIHLPPGKEIPFFSRDERYERGWEWYAQEFFSHAPAEALWGTVSPQYMSDPVAPRRMYETMPDVKMIAILRNPVYRAHSHYKMAVLRDAETRSFEQAVRELSDEATASHVRTLRTGIESRSQCYLAWGEYARILGPYYSLFPEEQILVLFSEELESAPLETYRGILRFLEVSPDFVPDNLGKRYHPGGTRKRTLPVDRLRKVEAIRTLWRMIPGRQRMILFRGYVNFNHWNTIAEPPSDSTSMDSQTLAKLVDYYRPEVDRLRDLLGREVPWPEFR
jgi:hypothetical protein